MTASLQGVKPGSLVHRFITSGKPGFCALCKKPVEKLEAHHIKYEPEITISICHSCHHTVHFWPNRLSQHQKFLILEKVHPGPKAFELSQFKHATVSDLAMLIAPSRKQYIHEAQQLEQKQLEAAEKPHLPAVMKKPDSSFPGVIAIKRIAKPSSPKQALFLHPEKNPPLLKKRFLHPEKKKII